jgi:hypothetical protein
MQISEDTRRSILVPEPDRETWPASLLSGVVLVGTVGHAAPADSLLWIAWNLGERRGERKFLVDKRPFGVWDYCTLIALPFMMWARRWQR